MANKSPAEIIGEKIKKFRMDLGDTQEAFAAKLDIGRPTLSLIEQGKQEPDIRVLINIIKVTKIDIMELLELSYKTHLVLDTNIILNCPYILNSLTTFCDFVYVPATVIKELNYQKDHSTEQKRKVAGMCLNKILELKGERFIIWDEEMKVGSNDDNIFAFVKYLAKINVNDMVYLMTNDVDFKLKPVGTTTNLKVITSAEFDGIFKQNINYNIAKSQKFFELVAKGALAPVKSFDIEGIDINYMDGRSGYTPLIQAIRDRNYQMIQYLLTLPNININSVDNKKFGFPPLSHAVQMHETGIMRTLIDNGANVNEPSTNDKNPFNTPLMIAAWGGRLESVRLLVENGACVNQQDKGNGFTPLIKAVFKGNIDIVKYLLEQGADKGVFSFEKKTALDYAYEKNHKEIIELLKG